MTGPALRIDRYEDAGRPEWDAFVERSRNGTFLFQRDYMDYHRDRFTDRSLVIRDGDGEILALFPANVTGTRVVSHGGLSYGGFVTDDRMTAARMLAVLTKTVADLRAAGITELITKTVPYIYHRQPAEEFSYAGFRAGATLYRRDVTTTVVPSQGRRWQERRVRSLKKARAAGLTCAETADLAPYWEIVTENLKTAHDLVPVHSVEEMTRLRAAFPRNIRLFGAYAGGEMTAGILVYETHQVAHAQYTATTNRGRDAGALDLLFHHLLTEVFAAKPYFDFGVSTEDDGRLLNEGLVAFKEGFGGRTVTLDFYRMALA